MTVLTKVRVSKVEDEPAHTQLVPEAQDSQQGQPENAAEDEVDAEAVRYLVLSRRARRVGGTSICLLAAVLLTISLCLLGGLFYYRQMHKSERLHAWCSVPYEGDNDDLLRSASHSGADFLEPKSKAEHHSADSAAAADDPLYLMPVFHEEFDIDIEEHLESMNVPEFEAGRSARFINDFEFDSTVIIPDDGSRVCLVTQLDRDIFLDPELLTQEVKRMQNELVSPEPLSITHRLLVSRAEAAMDDMARGDVGPRIQAACFDLPMFRLERRTMFRRSAEQQQSETAAARFTVYGGRGIVQYVITNLAELE